MQVDDWSDLVEGAPFEVRVTGHNTGGLECEVNHIRGFIPVSQISLCASKTLAQFVDQRLTCVISESDPERRNLVSAAARCWSAQREQARQQLLASLAPGQVRDGVVRKLMDFGAFVDFGGVDGLIHISQLAWGRVKHATTCCTRGRPSRCGSRRSIAQTGKISLGYRDLQENPWSTAGNELSAAGHRHRHGHPADGFRGLRRTGAGRRGTGPYLRASYNASVAAPTLSRKASRSR